MAKQKNKTNFVNHILIGLVLVCILLLVSEIISNTANELRANQSNEGYGVVAEFGAEGQLIEAKPSPSPTPTWDSAIPTPTFDITFGE